MKKNFIILLLVTAIAASSPFMQNAYMQEIVDPSPTSVPEPTAFPSPEEPQPTEIPVPTETMTEPTPTATAPAQLHESVPDASAEAAVITGVTDIKPAIPMTSVSQKPQAVTTSPAAATVTVVNTVNTNAIGGEPVIMLDAPADQTIDLSSSATCRPDIGQADISIENNAVIRNLLNIFAGTGANSVGADGSVATGNAASIANVANLANTNLIGSCWSFTLLNFFEGMGGDIVLPYELQFLNQTASAMRPAFPLQDMDITASNSSILKNDLLAVSGTGANTADRIETGNAEATVDVRETANTNRYGNNWLFVQVETGTGWNGIFENWQGDTLRTATGGYAWMKLPDGLIRPGEVNLDIANDAYVENGIRVTTDTGNNTAGANGSVKTGNALSRINLFDFINTNIIGSNWYFAYINLFGGFDGNVVFARPDLAVSGTTSKSARIGETFAQSVSLMNTGTHTAQNTRLVVSLPAGMTCVSVSSGSCGNGSISLELGDVAPGDGQTVSMSVRITDAAVPSVTTSWSAQTETDEPAKDNNTLLLTTQLSGGPDNISQPEVQAAAVSSNGQPENRVYGTLLKRDTTAQISLADYRDGNKGQVIGVRTGQNVSSGMPFRINFINILYVLVTAGIILRIVRFMKRRVGIYFVKRRLWQMSEGSLA